MQLRSLLLHILALIWLLGDHVSAQSPTVPRWGQAAALVQRTLYIQGGRTDQFNAFAYSSAPVTNDVLTLDLSTSFNVSSPPWVYAGGCTVCSPRQGPELAWHTLSPLTTSSLLVFGGDSGPNSPISLPVRADSSVLLDISNQNTTWDYVAESWAGEPVRRIFHSASSAQGKVWIVGGEKADGSGNAFSEHYLFDPTTPSFTQLPSSNGPTDILGHTSVVLPNGRLLVFGGYSPSQQSLVPFTNVWALDTTQSTVAWSMLPVAGGTLPAPRRGFAATVIDKDRVLIHGGADAVLQTSFSDGWILDTTQNPMVWTPINALSQLGPRRDHTAVSVGSLVLFAFGYANNGPAPATLFIFDTSSNTFQPTFSPPPPDPSSPINTLPGSSSPTSLPNPPSHGSPGNGNGQPGQPGFPSNPKPGDNNGGGGGGGNGGGGGGGGDGGHPNNGSPTTAIALGAVFGIVGLMLCSTALVWYMRRRHHHHAHHHHHHHHGHHQHHGRFHPLSVSPDNDDSSQIAHAIPVAGGPMRESGLRNVKDRLTGLVSSRTLRNHQPARRDILADEDTRQFDTDGWFVGMRRDPSSGLSSLKRPTLSDKVYGSLASLRSVGGAMLDYAAGTAVMRGLRKEESAGTSRSQWSGTEKEPSDPFMDDWGLVRLKESGAFRTPPTYGLHDPFEDHDARSVQVDYDRPPDGAPDEEQGFLSLSDAPPRPYIHTALPPAVDLTRLTPVTEKPSLSTLTDSKNTPDSSHSNLGLASSGTFGGTSITSLETPRSPARPPSTFTETSAANSSPPESMRRSNSWWTRFAKTSLLDRRSSDASRHRPPMEFRDPNPPPSRLIPIEEASLVNSRRENSGGLHQMYSSHSHGRSASSLQTSKTANSEVLDRLGTTIDIIQRGSHEMEKSSSTAEIGRPGPDDKLLLTVEATSSSHQEPLADEDPVTMAMSPQSLSPAGSPPPLQSPRRLSSPGNVVSERIKAYERRMSQQAPPLLKSPPPARARNRTSVYGIAPRPSLYVANPDRSSGGSGDT